MHESPHSRRKFARISLETKISVTFSGVDARRRLWIDNLGEGGVFLRSGNPKPVGTKISFEFLVRDRGPKISGTGVVQWVNRDPGGPPGMGIRFIELNDAGRAEIQEVLRKKKTAPVSGSIP